MSEKNEIFVVGGTVLTMNPTSEIFEDGVVHIKDGIIAAVGSRKAVPVPTDSRRVDASRCLVTPGFINGHTHTGMTLLRGMADDLPLERWLNDRIFPLEKRWVSSEFVSLSNLLAAAELIRSGVTTLNDMYYHQDAAAAALHRAGLRAILSETLVELGGGVDTSNFFGRYDEFLASTADFPLITPAVAPHALYSVSQPLWKEVIRFARNRKLPLHLHVSETQWEVDYCQREYGKTPVQFFDSMDLWSGPAIAAHVCVLSKEDISILGRAQAGVVHNPESNMKLGTHICPVTELRESGARVALGTDGAASNNNLDLLQEADTAAKLQSFKYGPGKCSALDVFRMMTSEGAEALGLGDRVGSLEVGKAADLVAVDLSKPHAVPFQNPYSHLIYSASAADVKHTMVQGRMLMEDYCILSFDEKGVLEEAARWGKKIAQER